MLTHSRPIWHPKASTIGIRSFETVSVRKKNNQIPMTKSDARWSLGFGHWSFLNLRCLRRRTNHARTRRLGRPRVANHRRRGSPCPQFAKFRGRSHPPASRSDRVLPIILRLVVDVEQFLL